MLLINKITVSQFFVIFKPGRFNYFPKNPFIAIAANRKAVVLSFPDSPACPWLPVTGGGHVMWLPWLRGGWDVLWLLWVAP